MANPNNTKRPSRRDAVKTSGGTISFTVAHPAIVEELIGNTGARGEATQVRCKVQDGPDANKIVRKNVKGPVRVGDTLMLRNTEIEAQKLNQKRR